MPTKRMPRRGLGVGILATLALVAAFQPASAQAPANGCTVNGQNIFCDTCAAANSAPLSDRTVTLSGNVVNGMLVGSQNSFCEIVNLEPNETLDLTVNDNGSGSAFDVDFDGQIPSQTISPQSASGTVPQNGSIIQSFSSGAQSTARTRANANIRQTQSTSQNFSVSATVVCSCTPAQGQNALLTVNKTTSDGGTGTFSFVSNNAAFTKANLVVNGSAQIGSATLTAPFNAVTINETVQDANYTSAAASCVRTGTNTTFPSTFVGSTLSVTPQAGDNVTCTITNIAADAGAPNVILRKVTNDGSTGTFTFTSNLAGLNTSLTTTGGSAQTAAQPAVAGQQVTITEADPGPDYQLTGANCSGGVFSGLTFTLGTRTLSFTPTTGTITCTFNNRRVKDDDGDDVTEVFIHRRVDNLLTHGPDRARLLRRFDEERQGSLKDEPLKLQGEIGENESGQVKFATSLAQMASAAQAAKARRVQEETGLAFGEGFGNTVVTTRPGLDIWVEGHISTYDDDTGGFDRDGDFKILYVGADYFLTPSILIGALVQVDRTNEDVRGDDLKGTIDGTGWMAGPYLGIKLRDNLFFDARAAWGQSDNDLDLTDSFLGRRKGSFDTDRWLATASLTGNYYYGAFRVSPQVEIAYGSEDSEAFRTTADTRVGSHDATLGRLSFGPEFGYKYTAPGGTVVEPHLMIKGLWNFDRDDIELSTGIEETEEFRALIEGGVIFIMPGGYSVRGAATYDGIGDDDFESWSGKAWVNFPLN